MIIKAIVAKTKFGLLILDSDNEDFEDIFIEDSSVGSFVSNNKELNALEKEEYGLYECELSWVEEEVYIESYKSNKIAWDVNGVIIKVRSNDLP